MLTLHPCGTGLPCTLACPVRYEVISLKQLLGLSSGWYRITLHLCGTGGVFHKIFSPWFHRGFILSPLLIIATPLEPFLPRTCHSRESAPLGLLQGILASNSFSLRFCSIFVKTENFLLPQSYLIYNIFGAQKSGKTIRE